MRQTSPSQRHRQETNRTTRRPRMRRVPDGTRAHRRRRASDNGGALRTEVGAMKREFLRAAVLSLATFCAVPACSANDRPTSQPTTQPTTKPAARRTADARQTTGQKYQESVRKQDQTKRSLRDRVLAMSQANGGQGELDVPPPPTPAEVLADAQARLDAENARHTARLAELRREEAAARSAGDRRKAQKLHKNIEAENEAYDRTAADLRRQVRDAQARVDAEASR